MNTSSYYSLGYTLWKGFWTWAVASGVGCAADVAAVGMPETWDEFTSKWPVLLIALAPALWRVLENVRKNAGAGGPLWSWPWDKVTPVIVVCLALGAGLAGCETMKTTTTSTTETGTTTTETSSWTLNTEQLTALVGVAGGVVDLVEAVGASTDTDTGNDSVVDQVTDAALDYVLDYLTGTKAAVVMPSADVARARGTAIALDAFEAGGRWPEAQEVAAYVVTGRAPSDRELGAFRETGRLTLTR